MTAQEDTELFEWLINASGHGTGPAAGDFLKNLAEAGLRADAENYSVLRPVLVVMAMRYPKYQ
jgi:hypothetical protein